MTTCESIREALSALSDGEEAAIAVAIVDGHVETCMACRQWRDADLPALRRAQLGIALTAPDRADQLTAALVASHARASAPRLIARVALGAVAALQVALSVPELILGHDREAPLHVAHELGSFTLAIASGFAVAALRPRRAWGMLPLLLAATVLLMGTAIVDLATGRSDVPDELPHLLTAVGVLLVWRVASTSGGAGRGAALARRLRAVIAHRRPTRGYLTRGAIMASLIGATFAIAGPASAHATLDSSSPAPRSISSVSPPSVRVHFDEPVSTVDGSLRVLDANGDRVDVGVPSHPDGAGSDVAVAVRDHLPGGTYLVSWRVVSADSHPVNGAFTFSVGAPGVVPALTPAEAPREVGVALGVARWVSFAGLALLVGALAFLLLCWPMGWQRRGARGVAWAGWAGLLAGSLASLVIKGPLDAATGLSRAADPALLSAVVDTPYGHALVVRLLVLTMMGVWIVSRVRRGASRIRSAAGVVLVAGLLATWPAAGHAGTGEQAPVAALLDALHVGAMAVWLGGLVLLATCVLAGRVVAGTGAFVAEGAAAVVCRFSRLALICVGVLVTTGTYQTWREVGTLPALPATTYGRLLLAKLTVFAGLLVAAACARWWARRRLTSVTGLRTLRRVVASEVIAAMAILAVTAGLVSSEPARSAYHPTIAEDLHAGPVDLQLSVVPSGNRQVDIHAYLYDRSGQPLDAPELTGGLRLPAQGIGPLSVHFLAAGPGHFVADRTAVPVAGNWEVDLGVRTTEIDVYPASATIPIR